jgi:hypothetical protein
MEQALKIFLHPDGFARANRWSDQQITGKKNMGSGSCNKSVRRFDPINKTGQNIVIVPCSGATAAQQLLRDYGLITGEQIGQ